MERSEGLGRLIPYLLFPFHSARDKSVRKKAGLGWSETYLITSCGPRIRPHLICFDVFHRSWAELYLSFESEDLEMGFKIQNAREEDVEEIAGV